MDKCHFSTELSTRFGENKSVKDDCHFEIKSWNPRHFRNYHHGEDCNVAGVLAASPRARRFATQPRGTLERRCRGKGEERLGCSRYMLFVE
jgi:hypothetical protein